MNTVVGGLQYVMANNATQMSLDNECDMCRVMFRESNDYVVYFVTNARENLGSSIEHEITCPREAVIVRATLRATSSNMI